MVGSSKILTVSYGTFSCTLEGFDDPFSTMRSIAEYFRDLAADDRYFGAEPPTPDADMLHRIAEKEVQRRVESRVQNDGIVLRQVQRESENIAGNARPASGAAPATAAAQRQTEKDEKDTTSHREVAAVEADDVETGADTLDAPEPLAGEAATEVEKTAAEGSDQTAPDAETEETTAELIEGLYAEDEELAAEAPGEPAAAASFALPENDDNSVAAKLSRIRAVVSGGAHAQPVPQQQDRFAGSIEAAFADDLAIDDAEFEDVPNVNDTAADEEAEFAAWDADEEALEEFPAEDAETGHAAEFVAETETEPDDAAQDDDAESEAALAEAVAASDQDFAVSDAEPEEGFDAFSAGEDAQDEAAEALDYGLAERLVQMKREAAGDAGAMEEAQDSARREMASSLSDDEEADLMADLAEAEREDAVSDGNQDADVGEAPEIAAEAAPEPDDDGAMLAAIASATANEPAEPEHSQVEPAAEADAEAEDQAADTQNRHPGFDIEKTEDAAFDRILEQTNSRMDDSEGSRRRSAIAHLKAAVAATKADRLLKQMHPEEEAAEEQSQYRDDLAKVVQPRRPLTQPRDENPHAQAAEATQRPSPLVLVSEQRVDPDGGQDDDIGEDVHPRRVTTREVPAASGEEGFADFAAKMGATELPDLLEAAAAYTAFVEGNKLFSRPQLMRRVAYMETGEEFTREAGLRSFGQLLRQGKIQKLRRGQFTISEETKFNPQARLAGE